ncbi:MAG: hypothetical protein JNJ71_19230 [Rubrivivax sp.]|nr:hypothetical protein [Rubrivivax sp.]
MSAPDALLRDRSATQPAHAASWPPESPAGFEPRRVAGMAAAALAALSLPSLVAWGFDERLILGVSVWAKPLKFQLSFALHWLTIAWLLGLVHPHARASRGLRTWVAAGALAALLEVAYITLQAARGRASHFNFETPLETVLYYALMGGAAQLMMATTLAVGVWLWHHPRNAGQPALRLGGVLGLIVGSVVTVIVTAPLAAGVIDGPGPWIGGVRSNAAGLPITGWSTTGGDLRVPHFFAAHLIQALPVAGWLADRWAPARGRSLWVWATLVIGLAVVAASFVQALQGVPLIGT